VIGNFIGVMFDGVAYGSLLFVISIGLSVTMGLMNFVNLAHGAFAMLGGYACVVAMSRMGVPFLATLPLAFVISALAGAVLERLLYRRLYRASHLDQVLFSIGLVFMSIAGATFVFGSQQQPVQLPAFLRGQVHFAGLDLGSYRLFLIAVVITVTLALTWLVERTRFGAEIRASVDNRQAAAGLGINVYRVFSLTFALGSGLAGLGGGLGIDVLGLDPTFPPEHSVLPAGGGSRRRRNDQRTLARGADPRRVRRCRQVLRAADRLVHHLLRDGGDADPLPARGPRQAP
jgi:branched-chain amino acid transport system permease protein